MVYIYAFPVQQSIVYLFSGIRVLSLSIASWVVTLLLDIFSWKLVEKPSLKQKDKYTYIETFFQKYIYKK